MEIARGRAVEHYLILPIQVELLRDDRSIRYAIDYLEGTLAAVHVVLRNIHPLDDFHALTAPRHRDRVLALLQVQVEAAAHVLQGVILLDPLTRPAHIATQ